MSQHDVLHDPLFHELVRRHELAVRRLREDVIRMRAFYLQNKSEAKIAADYWQAAQLQNQATSSHDLVRDTAADLLKFAFEIAPHSTNSEHLAEIAAQIAAHEKRMISRSGWGEGQIFRRGPEEKVKIDDGPPITIILNALKPPAGNIENKTNP